MLVEEGGAEALEEIGRERIFDDRSQLLVAGLGQLVGSRRSVKVTL